MSLPVPDGFIPLTFLDGGDEFAVEATDIYMVIPRKRGGGSSVFLRSYQQECVDVQEDIEEVMSLIAAATDQYIVVTKPEDGDDSEEENHG